MFTEGYVKCLIAEGAIPMRMAMAWYAGIVEGAYKDSLSSYVERAYWEYVKGDSAAQPLEVWLKQQRNSEISLDSGWLIA